MKAPYGMTTNGARCINSEPGTFNHECEKPATWIGTNATGFSACYCDKCKNHGYEARRETAWQRIAEQQAA